MKSEVSKVIVGVRFPAWMLKELDTACGAENRGGGVFRWTRAAMIRNAVGEYLERRARQVKRAGGAR